MSDQRSKTRDKLVGAYISPELKELMEKRAAERNLTVSDYLRKLIEDSVGAGVRKNGKKIG